MLCLLLMGGMSYAQVNYAKRVDLPPLRVSFVDLQAVIERAAKLATTANNLKEPLLEEISVKAGAVQVTIPGRNLTPANAKIPEKIDSLAYKYLTSGQLPVTRISFDFDDFNRTLTVEGGSPEQVDAIFAATREDLSALSSSVGGRMVKSYLGLPAYGLLISLVVSWSMRWYNARRTSSLIGVLLGLTGIALLALLPIDDLLAGFMAIRGEPSWLVRYGPQMSFFGFIIALFGVPALIKSFATNEQSKVIEPQPSSLDAERVGKSLECGEIPPHTTSENR